MGARSFPRVILGALLLAAGLLGLVFLLFNLGQDVSLWLVGRRTMAQVVEQWAEPLNDVDEGEVAFRYYIRYRFMTPEGQVVTNTSSVSAVEWAGLGSGGRGSAGFDAYDQSSVPAAAPVYQEEVHIPPETLGGLQVGSDVAVVYLPIYPAHNRLDESRYAFFLGCSYLPLLLLSGGVGLVGWRLIRQPTGEAHKLWQL